MAAGSDSATAVQAQAAHERAAAINRRLCKASVHLSGRRGSASRLACARINPDVGVTHDTRAVTLRGGRRDRSAFAKASAQPSAFAASAVRHRDELRLRLRGVEFSCALLFLVLLVFHVVARVVLDVALRWCRCLTLVARLLHIVKQTVAPLPAAARRYGSLLLLLFLCGGLAVLFSPLSRVQRRVHGLAVTAGIIAAGAVVAGVIAAGVVAVGAVAVGVVAVGAVVAGFVADLRTTRHGTSWHMKSWR